MTLGMKWTYFWYNVARLYAETRALKEERLRQQYGP